MTRRTAAALVIGFVVLLLAGAAWRLLRPPLTQTLQLDRPVTGVELVDVSGDVTIGHGSEASVRREVRQPLWAKDTREPELRDDGVLRLYGCGPTCTVEYAVTLPDAVVVTGELGAGNVEADAVTSARLHTGAGRIDIGRSSGPLDLDVDAGDITATSSGAVRAKVGAGSVHVVLDEPSDVRAETGTGDVEVRVPEADYRVEASTGVGDKDLQVPDAPGAEHVLTLITGTGSLRLHH